MSLLKEEITLLIDRKSWFNKFSLILKKKLENRYKVNIISNQKNISEGLINFIISYNKKLSSYSLKKNKYNIVVHESNLPKGRGFSPMTWQILKGKKNIPIVLFEADKSIDSGKIIFKDKIVLKGHELFEEWKEIQGVKTIDMCIKFIKKIKSIKYISQRGKPSYYRRRTIRDSEININLSIKKQFNLLRTVDNDNYPAFFKYKKNKYRLKIEKI